MRLRPALAVLAVLALASPLLPSATAAVEQGTGSESLVPVANLPYEKAPGSGITNGGTDIEFAEIDGTEYALAGSYKNGLQIVDIDDPKRPTIAGVYACGVEQGDVQHFQRDGRHYVGYTLDTGYTPLTDSRCFTEARGLGFTPGPGTFIADITEVGNTALPASERIRTVSFVPVPKGSHNHTIHPSGKYLYNSNSSLATNLAANAIEIFDISDLRAPKPLPSLDLPPVPTSLGADSHDITFNTKGDRAYSAALSQTAIIDTSDPAAPTLISTIVDPTINVVHQSDPVTITDPVLGERDFLVIEDEFVGALGTGQCPNGGVHVYDVTGSLEATPVKVGYWNIDEVRTTSDSRLGTCTAHVFDLHEEAGIMTIAYYNGGVRVVDLSGLVGVALGGHGVGMEQVGFRRFANSDTWSAKTNKIKTKGAKAGSFFLYGNDQRRGLDVYAFTPAKVGPSDSKGTWLSAEQAAVQLADRARIDLSGYRMRCLPADAAPQAAAALSAAHH